jgi:hypothetical protein
MQSPHILYEYNTKYNIEIYVNHYIYLMMVLYGENC